MFLSEDEVWMLVPLFYKIGVIIISEKPIQLASGIESRIFFNARAISQDTKLRETVLYLFNRLIKEELKQSPVDPRFNVVCSVPHGADHLALLVGQNLSRPLPVFQFERDANSYFLSERSLENLEKICPGRALALIVDDVLTTGLSSGEVCRYLKSHNINPSGLVCLVDRQHGGRKALAKIGVKQVHCLMTMEAVLRALIHQKVELGVKLPLIVKPEEEKVVREELQMIIRSPI